MGCRRCGGDGYEKLTQCPFKEVPSEVWEMIDICEFAEKGMPPVLAGYHQQTASFIQCLRAVRSERAYFRNLTTKPTDG